MRPEGVTLIHSSDWHIGAGLAGWPDDLVERRSREREQAVLAVVAAARERRADFLVVAGDLVDGQRSVPGTIRDALGELQAGGTEVVGLFVHSAGGHDSEVMQEFASWFPGTILRPGDAREVAGVRFIGCDRVPMTRELEVVPAGDQRIRVVVLHSHEPATARSLKPLRGLACYVALGDCHQYSEVARGFAYYCGAPSFRDLSSIDPGARFALSVMIDGSRECRVETVPIETPMSAKLEFDDPFVRLDDIEAAILHVLRGADYVRVRLSKRVTAGVPLLERALSARGLARVVPWKRTRSAHYRQYLLVRC